MAEKKLTPEIEARLRSYAPITVSNEFEYIPEIYKEVYQGDKSKWPVFTLKAAGGVDKIRAHDEGNLAGTLSKFGAYSLSLCDGRVLGWRNYKDASGKEIPFDASLQALPPALLHELASVISEPPKLSDEEVTSLK